MPGRVKRVVFLSGKVFYDLAQLRKQKGRSDTAFIRLEELAPFPYDEVRAEMARFPLAERFYWLQEEQQNAGGWAFVAPRFAHLGLSSLHYIGRPPLSSSAVGVSSWHGKEQTKLLADAFDA
jgi:2-oxoglutarate dehydrogenase complex dehydrogenase (E1) component-like enzyme